MEKNYKELALNHVRDVCPELRELSFGCRVMPIDIKEKEHYYAVKKWSSNDSLDTYCVEDDQNYNLYDEEYILIGHTPHLEHWLRGMKNTEVEVTVWPDDCVTLELGMTCCKYNLTKDGENQSEEFYKAYCEIVGV